VSIFDKLGDMLKSYLDDADSGSTGKPHGRRSAGDPDLDAAYDELEDFLRGKGSAKSASSSWNSSFNSSASGNSGNARYNATNNNYRATSVPESLRPDFAELGIPFGSNAEECKAAHKRLLKIHHPDRHAGHEGNMKKATEKSAKINNAYERIAQWRKTDHA
jgi:curved DNA-binding protein CbpA